MLNLILSMPAIAAEPGGTAAAQPAANAPAAPATSPAAEPTANSNEAPNATVARKTAETELLAEYSAGRLGSDYIQLGGDTTPFIGRFSPASREPVNRAVLYVGAQGQLVSADPLASALLSEFSGGWAVLAPQMPLLARTSDIAAYVETETVALERVRLALAYLAEENYDTVVVVGKASGATLLGRNLAEGVATGISAFAIIGPWQGSLDDVTLPVLEVTDTALLGRPAKMRGATVRKAGDDHYERVLLEATDSDVASFNDEIAARIHGWAERVAIAKPP